MLEPFGNSWSQVAPQSIPAGFEPTVPLPAPALVTVRVRDWAKVAVQDRAAFIVTDPSEQSVSPLHPAKAEPAFATALKATTVPSE